MRPTCTLCRRRKVKCDRTAPCGNCVRAGVDCVPSIVSHAPRGRQGGRRKKPDNKDLLARIANLEELVNYGQGRSQVDSASTDPLQCLPSTDIGRRRANEQRIVNGSYTVHGSTAEKSINNLMNAPGDPGQQPVPLFDQYLGGPIWTTLSQEIGGLKEVLTSLSDDENDLESERTTPESLSETSAYHTDSAFLMLPPSSAESPSNVIGVELHVLCEAYIQNVDPVFKVLHVPSLRKHLQRGSAQLDCSPGPKGLQALKMAICYAAAISMTDVECRSRVGEPRIVLCARIRQAVECALAKADFLNTMELSTLQALTIYLAAVRTQDSRRLTWTMISVAVRIAQAMGLHTERQSSSFRPFEREMRRRLWWQIGTLDCHAAQDRATIPIVHTDVSTTKMPLNINDEDLDIDAREIVEQLRGFTDMTFCLVCHELRETVGKINYGIPEDTNQSPNDLQKTPDQKISTILDVQKLLDRKYFCNVNLTRPLHWATRTVADNIIAILWLAVYRPLMKSSNRIYHLQPTDPDILGLSVAVLENSHRLHTDPVASAYRWLTLSYVQWHALAVTAAELCVRTAGPLVERAWRIIEPSFELASHRVADSSRGMLWRPIRKLMKRAQALRNEYIEAHSMRGDSILAPTQRDSILDNGLWMGEELRDPQVIHQGDLDFSISTPLDWTPWTVTGLKQQSGNGSFGEGSDQLSWTAWESFMQDVQSQEEADFISETFESMEF